MVEVRTAILIIVAITVTITMSAIFAGCNEAFSNVSNGVSSEKICEGYSDDAFEKCVIKQNERENICVDYFSWLRFS